MRRAKIKRLTAIILCLLPFPYAGHLHAQTGPTYYYVSTTGNDSNPGSESLPWKTLAKAASTTTSNTTVFIKKGTYNEPLVPVNSGTSEGLITFTSYPGDSVTITGAGIKFPTGSSNDRWWNGLIHIEGQKYIRISGLRVVNSEASGILVRNSSYVTIEKNYTDNTYSPGIDVVGCDNVVVEANEVVHGCTGGDQECISVGLTNLFEIKNNRVHDGLTEGIDVKAGSSNGIVSKNEVYNQRGLDRIPPGIYIDAWEQHEFNIDVFDNISHDNGHGFAVAAENGGLNEGIRIHHNIAYKNSDRGFIMAGWGIGQTHTIKNIAIYGNASYDNRVGIEMGGYTGTTMDSVRVYNNLIYHNITGVGITRYDGPSGQYVMRNIEIVNNTIYENGASSSGWSDGGINVSNISPENVFIRNNILSNNAAYTICVQPEVSRAGVTIDYNFFNGFRNFPNETAGTNAVNGSPLFVDTLKNDYHLQTTSPCIDKGNPSQEYNDPADPNKPGYALYPALGTVRNDVGAYGGPYASSLDTAVIAAPLTPTLVGPANGEKSISITPTLSWERAMGAVTYRLQISLNFWFSTNVVDDSTIAETFKPIGPLQNGMTYFWRVNAKNEGGTSAWSQVSSFTTIVVKLLGPTFYVSPAGNDSNPGTEPLPWKTLAKAASTATANTTVFIRQGIYRERLVPVNSGTPVGPITFTSYPGDSVTITGVGMIPPTGWWAGLIWIQGLSYIKISGLRVINSVNTGIDVENCSHITIEKNYVDSTYSPGIKAYASNNVTVEGNEVVFGCIGLDEESISISMTDIVEVKNNRVHDGVGIDVKNGSSNAIVTRNEVYNSGNGIYIEAWDKHEYNIDVFDNISHDNTNGIAVASENGGLIEGIKVHHNTARNCQRGFVVAGWGIGQTHPLKNIKVYGNESYENGFGIEIGGYTGTTFDSIKVYNNMIYHNKGVGVRITRYDGPSGAYAMRNVSVINNTIYGNGTVGNGWDADNGGMNIFNVIPVNLLIRNNILSNNTICTIYLSPEVLAGSLTIDYNFFDGFRNFMNETAGTNAIYGNPLFVDSLRNDYHLQATSPCIDQGNPSQEYNDPADPKLPGYALYPAQGTLRNDMGAYGGSYATSWNVTTSVKINSSALPEIYELYQNYPNPFNPSTTISFLLPSKSFVSLKIFDLLGRNVATLVSEEMLAGNYSQQWSAANLSSGIYFYRLQAGSFTETKKLILLK